MQVKRKKIYQSEGYAVIMSVVLLSAVGVFIATTLLLLGLANSQTNFSVGQSMQANGLASACAETALNSLLQDANYTGGESMTLGSGTCQILNVVFDDLTYSIYSTGSVGSAVRKISIQAQRQTGPASMQIVSWQEVAGF